VDWGALVHKAVPAGSFVALLRLARIPIQTHRAHFEFLIFSED
jgi:hypothetical protein